MRRRIACSVIVVACLSTTAGAALQEPAPTPAERFKTLLHEYETVSGGRVSSDEERLKVIARVFQRRSVNSTPWPADVAGQDPAAAKALALLARDHLGSDRVAP